MFFFCIARFPGFHRSEESGVTTALKYLKETATAKSWHREGKYCTNCTFDMQGMGKYVETSSKSNSKFENIDYHLLIML